MLVKKPHIYVDASVIGGCEDEEFSDIPLSLWSRSRPAVFLQKRREELSRAYAGLTAEQIEERVRQLLKDDPLWQGRRQSRKPMSPGKRAGGCP